MDCRVAYRDRRGSVREGDLASVTARALVTSAPWRVFRWRQGQAHYSGWYWAATTGGHVVYESRLELARLLLADFDPGVVAIAAQPFRVTAQVEGRGRTHVPDFLLVHADDTATVVNVKPAEQLARTKVAEALGWAQSVFASRGWRHEVWSGAPAMLLSNVRFLSAYRYRDRVDPVDVARLQRDVTTSVFLGELETSFPERTARVRAAALHLLWRGVFRADLDSPLSAATVLERAA